MKIHVLSTTGDLVKEGPGRQDVALLQRLWAAACWLPVLRWPRESIGVSLSQMDVLVEGDPASAATARRGEQGCQARLLDVVVIAEGLEIGEGGK